MDGATVTSETGSAGPDPAVVRRARDGDADAFRELAREVRPLISRWALARTGDLDEAEEVAQEVLLRLHRHLDSFDGRARFTTWLYRVTANAAATLEADRRRRARRSERMQGEPADPAREGKHPADRVHEQRLAALVKAYLDELPDRQREAFDLVDLQGLTPAEAAERMCIEPSTARVHLHRARRTLRGRIVDTHPELEGGYGA